VDPVGSGLDDVDDLKLVREGWGRKREREREKEEAEVDVDGLFLRASAR